MMDAVDTYEAPDGMYPIAFDRRWHPGMHLAPKIYNERIRAIADGEVVAYRVCQRAYDGGGGISDSNAGFVLLKHTTETGEGRTLTFYSLYMHLLDLNGYQRLGADGKFLPEFLRTPSPDAGLASLVVPPAQSGGGKKVRRKDVLGLPGRCHGRAHLHVEIFMTKQDFEAYFGHTQLGREQMSTPATTDYWGTSYYVIPPGQPFYPVPPGSDSKGHLHGVAFDTLLTGNNEDTLYVESYFHKGSKYTTVSRDAGHGRLEALTEMPVREADYEYNLYKRAMALYPDCPSDGYEMLRFGRILSAQVTLAPTARSTWMRVAFAKDQEGYIDVSQASILKLSDADFPFFSGWKKISEGVGLHSDDGLCDIDALKKILSDTKARETAAEKAARANYDKDDELVRYVKTHKPIRDALRGFVCEAPSEWDGSHNDAKFRKLKEPGEFYDGNEAGYAKFIKLLESLQFWDKTGLPAGEKLWFFHPMAFIRHFRKCPWLSEREFKQLVPRYAPRRHAGVVLWEPISARFADGIIFKTQRIPLNCMARKFGIDTPERIASFYGNALQETQWLTKLSEANLDARYAPWDGRGFLQLTWPSNYMTYWDFKGRSKQIPNAVRAGLLAAQEETNKTRNNEALSAVEARLTPDMLKWREDAGDVRAADPTETAGFYWASLRMALHADQVHALERIGIGTSKGPKCYYRSPSFWKASAAVNLPGALNTLYSAKLNGFEARCIAYAAVLAITGEHPFPLGNGNFSSSPDGDILGQET